MFKYAMKHVYMQISHQEVERNQIFIFLEGLVWKMEMKRQVLANVYFDTEKMGYPQNLRIGTSVTNINNADI